MAASIRPVLVLLATLPLVPALQSFGEFSSRGCAFAPSLSMKAALGHGVRLGAASQTHRASGFLAANRRTPLVQNFGEGSFVQSFGVCKGNKPSTLHRAQGDGALGLRSQQDSDIDDDASVAQAEETEKQVQQIVLGSLAALVTLGIGGYCVYSGQNPIELVEAILATDPQQFLQDTVTYIEGLGPLGYAYFAAVYVVAEMLAIPAVPLTASAGYLFGVGAGTAVVLVSATIAAGGAFLVGRLFLRQWVEKYILKSRKFVAIDEAISRKGFQLVLLLRLSPLLPFALSNYIYGMTKVNFWEYLLGTLIGFAPGTLGFVLTGQVGRELTGIEGAASGGLPWYGYAAGMGGIVVLGKVVTGVASNAIAEVEEEMKAKRKAKKAEEAAAAAGGGGKELSDAAKKLSDESLTKRL